MAAIQHDEIRPDHLVIQSLLCGFHAFEGFINLAGEEIAPEVWKDEREFFGKGAFRGIQGKVEFLFTLFPQTQLKKGEEPFQTFAKLKLTRDALAHNRVFRYDEITPNENPEFITRWDVFDSPAKIGKALIQLKLFAEMIRVEAVKILKEEYQLSHLHYPAFEGPICDSTGQKEANRVAGSDWPPAPTPPSVRVRRV